MARLGSMPPAAQYTTSFPSAMAMPPTPQSPMPRIASASVATIRSTSSGSRFGGRQRRLDQLRGVDRQVHAPGPAVLVAVALDGLPDRRRVDDRQHLPQMVGQEPVEEDLVTVVEGGEEHVLGQRGGLGAVLGVGPGRLLLEGEHLVGHEARQPQASRSSGVKPGALVDAGIAEHLPAPQPCVPRPVLLPRGAHGRTLRPDSPGERRAGDRRRPPPGDPARRRARPGWRWGSSSWPTPPPRWRSG